MKYLNIKRTLVFVILFLLSSTISTGQVQLSENFDGTFTPTIPTSTIATETNYVSSATGTWSLFQVRRYTSSFYSSPNSIEILRANNGYLITPTLNSVGTITLYGLSSGPSVRYITIEKSVNGAAYQQVGTINILGNASSWNQGTLAVNELSSNVKIKIIAYNASAGGDVRIDNVVITSYSSGSVINVSTNSLSDFGNIVSGLNSPSSNYTVSGSGLTADISITAPTSYQVSTDDLNFSGSVTLTHSNGSVPTTPVYTRFAPSSPSGSITGNITHTSTNAATKIVSVSGIALASEPSTQSSITFGTITDSSIVVNFSGGNGNKRIVVARSISPVSWIPTDANAVVGVNSRFISASDLGSGNRCIYDGSGSTVTVTGLTQNTLYHFAVYEYNAGTNNSQNYNTTSPGIGNQTTIAVPTIVVSPTSLAFGNVEINTTSVPQNYTLSGELLSPASGNIVVTAPSGFSISTTSDSGFDFLLSIPYSGGVLTATNIYVRFNPTTLSTYNVNISNAGGSATTKNVNVTGTGVVPSEGNVFQAENGILVSSYIRTQYSGYTGTGYVDMADKTGSSVEFVFSRASAATDNIGVRFANGGSNRSLAVHLNDVSIGTLNFPNTGNWSTWSTATISIGLQAGINRLRFTLGTNGSGPNLDKITVGGQTATPIYKLTLTKSGNGTVSANPLATYYEAGTLVTLTAEPNSGNVFYRWGGTDESNSNPFIVTMNSHKTIFGVMTPSAGFGSFPYESGPKGFASVGAFGYPNGTTGGTGADQRIEYVTNSTDLMSIMFRRVDANRTLNFPPLTVYVIGTLVAETGVAPMLDIKELYDVSIIGVGTDATITGFGLNISRSKNVIVRNLKFMNAPDDGITIQGDGVEGTGNHIWIDHCTFTNCYDGALDVTNTSSYVTASWNYFYKHDKVSLQGNSDTKTSDVAMKATWHHNYFDSTGQRHPRVRFGKSHVYNNYYRKNTLYGVSSNLEADVMVEGNYFLNVPIPFETSRDGSPPGDLVARDNILAGTTGPGSTRGTAFEPSTFYSYTIDSPEDIPAMLTSYAGSGKYDFSGGEPTTTTPTYTLAINAVNGSVLRDPAQAVYDSGSTVQLTAVPATGYNFVDWSGDLSGSSNPTSIIMNSNKNVTANFAINQYTITATAGPNGSINPSGVINVNYGDSLQFTITPNIGYRIDSVIVNGVYQGNMSTYTFRNISANHFITVKFSVVTQILSFIINPGWNMVSVPLTVSDYRKSELFPNSISDAFSYEGGYILKDTLRNGIGYWVKFQSAEEISMVGSERLSDSVDVNAGWNMIGSISLPILTNSVKPSTNISITTPFYGYQNGYILTDTIKSGNAYWVKVSGAGKLYFANENGMRKPINNPTHKLETLNKITITDATGSSRTLYFGADNDVSFPLEYFELPPSAPEGTFDVRYRSHRTVEIHKPIIEKPEIYPILISSAVFPVTISWDVQNKKNEVYELSENGIVTALAGIGRKEFSNNGSTSISLIAKNAQFIPNEFTLSQNYPNPFNPTTQIKFSVDKTEKTTLEIFDLLGQKVVTLFDDVAEMGKYYTIKLDAIDLTSGVYYYKLQNEQKSQVKKFLLLK